MKYTVSKELTITATGYTEAVDCDKATDLLVSIGGTASTLTVGFQYSDDVGGDWFDEEGTSKGASSTMGKSTTAKGGWEFDCTLYRYFRLNVTALESGKNLKVVVRGTERD